MPSPFPGMDPFLEHPDFFPGLHAAMHVYIQEALQPLLPPPYFAVINERLYVESLARHIEPDTDVLQSVSVEREEREGGGGIATQPRTQPVVIEVTDDERREKFLEIRTRRAAGGERVVTTIEVLSLSNKTPGERGRELYLQKQREVLRSKIHLVEIDLLRSGEHTTALPLERLKRKAGPFDYHVSVSRFDQPDRFFSYPWQLEEPMPEILVPLLPGDGDVLLDLQQVFTRCYDTGPFRRRVAYDINQIMPPLDQNKTEWVKEVLAGRKAEGGRRKAEGGRRKAEGARRSSGSMQGMGHPARFELLVFSNRRAPSRRYAVRLHMRPMQRPKDLSNADGVALYLIPKEAEMKMSCALFRRSRKKRLTFTPPLHATARSSTPVDVIVRCVSRVGYGLAWMNASTVMPISRAIFRSSGGAMSRPLWNGTVVPRPSACRNCL